MQRTLFRALSAVAIAALISTAFWSSNPASAHSSQEWSFSRPSEFSLEVFPHDTATSTFSDSWGNRRSGGRRHRGTDIISPRGTEILAVADGVVKEMGTSRLSGYFIRIEHVDEWITSYLHLNNDTYGTDDGDGGRWTAFYPTLQEGDEVVAGQVIGYVGDSGNAEDTIPNTHFEIKHEGEKKNPYPYLRDALEREIQDRYGLDF
ncbi:MAG: M23 family metallopeptidase [Actinomycetia bacterium]|nr:M23 family metallopeptidase [Actinomycetes bacterium]